jgi:2'-5' RNA ligase
MRETTSIKLRRHWQDARATRPRERRKFQPHLTIGRVSDTGPAQPALGELVAAQAHFNASLSAIDELLVVASYREKSGPTYTVRGRAGLR